MAAQAQVPASSLRSLRQLVLGGLALSSSTLLPSCLPSHFSSPRDFSSLQPPRPSPSPVAIRQCTAAAYSNTRNLHLTNHHLSKMGLGDVLTKEPQTVFDLYKKGAFPGAETVKSRGGSAPDAELNKKIALAKGDICGLKVDAIVNAAKGSLEGGGGIDQVIHAAAGPGLLEECKKVGPCEVGECKSTGSHNITNVKHIIHAVGPSCLEELGRPDKAGERDQLLVNCYFNSLDELVEIGDRTIAFPTISTGIFRFPAQRAADIALHTVRGYLEGPGGKDIDLVVFAMYEKKDWEVYEKHVPAYFPPTEPLPAVAETGKTGEQQGESAAGDFPEQRINKYDLGG
ncbi:hypothetical protein DFH27DRAFT_576509 [Peziza echinospora]|nr:hypothetical protein DFH27DRAFT_576509 [Peziza echinospora]